MSNMTSGSYTYASEMHDREFANRRLADEIGGLFLGAMPPQSFFDKCLPESNLGMGVME
jgi:hypothetical protein